MGFPGGLSWTSEPCSEDGRRELDLEGQRAWRSEVQVGKHGDWVKAPRGTVEIVEGSGSAGLGGGGGPPSADILEPGAAPRPPAPAWVAASEDRQADRSLSVLRLCRLSGSQSRVQEAPSPLVLTLPS